MTAHFHDAFGDSAKTARQLQEEQLTKTQFTESLFSRQGGAYRKVGKRTLDLLFVVALAPVALILISLAVLLLMISGSRPFYLQDRVGRNGRVFRILKLQTMVPNAKGVLEVYLRGHPEARREWEEKQKLTNDPRITRFGAVLRRTSLDELPQLWNVLKGDMSIVGPRPMMPDQRQLYPGNAYYAMRPGITGLWQVKARNDCSFATRADFDDAYEGKVSLMTDLGILLGTVGVVLRCTGH